MMRIDLSQIEEANQESLAEHQRQFTFLAESLDKRMINVERIVQRLMAFQVAIPSWALGAGGTRFGRFSIGGEPANLVEKIADVGTIHALTRTAGTISLHIPWDIPEDTEAIKELAKSYSLAFDAVNSNTFQDTAHQTHSYKFGSLSHNDLKVRKQAIQHNCEVIDIGIKLGSSSITIWLADGSSYPGQRNFRRALENTLASLRDIYAYMPENWKMYVEYKPYEPQFYHTVIQDWGTSFLLAQELGENAFCLVDLGHHLSNTNIEQIVATLLMKGKLGGFHFNDSKYGDDDLTVGCIKPYQLFLIFLELVYGMEMQEALHHSLAWMIDASHNVKDPLEDLMQSLEAIQIAYAQAMLVNRPSLNEAQLNDDIVAAQEEIQQAFRTDVRPMVAEARRRMAAALDPIAVYRSLEVRKQLMKERGITSVATGL